MKRNYKRKITKEQFERYLKVQESGITNMFDIKAVMSLTLLNEKQCLDIMHNYPKYKKRFDL